MKKNIRTVFMASILGMMIMPGLIRAQEMCGSHCGDKAACGINDQGYSITGTLETGFLAVMDHKIQFGKEGTYFSYNNDGGQDILFSVSRLSVDLNLSPKHTLVLLYQPLDIVTREKLRHDINIDGQAFASGTAMEYRYSFPFYRVSYLYDYLSDSKDELALGFSLQIRNTTIEFLDLDGSAYVRKSNIGPVPIIKFRNKHYLENGSFWGTEIDGFYAPISYLNGSDTEVVGAILDASVRYGMSFGKSAEAFMNVRYLGGGALGTSKEPAPSDGYTKNWLHFLTVSLGLSYSLWQ